MLSTGSFATKARLAAVTAVVALLVGCSSSQSANNGPYYASIGNPHPELPGFPKIARSDVRIYANVFDPHPEITMPDAGVFATTGGGAPYKPSTTQALVPQSANQTR
jgi:hypothetical protein